MALSLTNVSASAINTELGRSSTATLSWNDADLRKLGSTGNSGQSTTLGTPVSMTALQGKARVITSITSSTFNVNYTSLSGSYIPGKTWTTVTVNSGVVVGSSSTASPAMTISGTSGDIHELVNNGYIVGAGGNGGYGESGSYNPPGGPGNDSGIQSQGSSGEPGGNALSISYPVSITNNSNIWGGGGGGAGAFGGATGGKNSSVIRRGGGGGGAGAIVGSGQVNRYGNDLRGSDGTLTAGGAGYGQYSGSGGGPGEAGTQASEAVPRLVGGAAGYYATGSSNITWVVTGDRRGNVS